MSGAVAGGTSVTKSPRWKRARFDLSKDHPKSSVRTFLTRYVALDPTRKHFRYVKRAPDANGQFQAELHVPSFNCKVYVGMPSSTEKEAEKSAAEKFLHDSDVQLAAKNLPPTMHSIKRRNKADQNLKRQCRERGLSIFELSREQYNEAREKDWHTSI